MMMTTTTPAVHLGGVSKQFGAVTAVDSLSLRIEPGEIVALLGPNGAGKTTTVDMVLGLSEPTRGSVRVFGLAPREAMRRGLVSAVMQGGGLLGDYTVGETILLTSTLFAVSRPLDEVIRLAGIDHLRDRRVRSCSGGEQQRLRFALALLPDPELLILDEPTTGMDVQGRRDFWRSIRADAARGRTVIFATHYLDEADAYADRIVLVRHGSLVANGTAAEVKNLASGRTVRASLPGASQAALEALPGVDTVEVRGHAVLVRSRDSDAVVRHLVTQTAACDIEVTANNLEDAFLALTSDEPEGARP